MVLFSTLERQEFEQVERGTYLVSKLPTGANIKGRGVCLNCTKITESLSWPNDAFYSIKLAAGNVWAWNTEYLKVLKQYVSGEQRSDAAYARENTLFLYYLSRLPKYAVLKRNRGPLVKKINELLSTRNA